MTLHFRFTSSRTCSYGSESKGYIQEEQNYKKLEEPAEENL